MRNRDDWMELELVKQTNRLKYIDTVTNGKVHCDFPPRRVFIEPTNACNLNCVHCTHDGTMTRPIRHLDMDLFRKVMDDIAPWNRTTEICLFQQGEPLLHKDIVEMARIAGTEKDFFTKMNTNGVLLTKELGAELIKARLDYLVFSLDAINPDTYKKIKRRPYFERVINNILDYLEVWGDLDTGETRNYFACDVVILEERANREEIPVIKEMLERLPVGHVEVYELFNYFGAVEEANSMHPERFTTPRSQWPCCNSPWDVIGVRANGEAVACIYDYDNRYVVGDVREQTIEEIWNGEPMLEFRQALLDRAYERVEQNGPLCSNCTIMWMKDYQLPDDFYVEIARMQRYLDAAVDRVARRWPRTEALMEKHRYLKENREAWYQEFMARGRSIAQMRQKLETQGREADCAG